MPIEIRELHIKIKVNEHQATQQPLSTTASREQERKSVEDGLVSETVEQVMKLLKEQQER